MTFSSIKNKTLFLGVYKEEQGIRMCTNTSGQSINEYRVLLGMQNAPWYDKDLLANTISFSKLKNQYWITYDLDISDCFECHTEDGVVDFTNPIGGLYSASLPED